MEEKYMIYQGLLPHQCWKRICVNIAPILSDFTFTSSQER